MLMNKSNLHNIDPNYVMHSYLLRPTKTMIVVRIYKMYIVLKSRIAVN
jgi:hypothetical protein